MPTQTFDVDIAAVIQSGRWEYAYLATKRALVCFGNNSQLDMVINGSDASIFWAVTALGTNYMQASIDGGAFFNLALPGAINTYTLVSLFTGLTDGPHTVTLRHNAGTATNSYFQAVAGISVTGAAPSISAPSASSFGAVYRGPGGAFLRNFLPEGVVNTDISSGHKRLVLSLPDSSVRFRANPTEIQAFVFRNGSQVRVSQDGVPLGAGKVTLPNTSGYGWESLITGLDGAYHNYHISSVAALIPAIINVNLIGGDIDPVTRLIQRAAARCIGDSITMGVGTADSSLAFPWRICQLKGYQCINRGVSGIKQLETTTAGNGSERNNPDYDVPNVYPDLIQLVIYNSGHNDNGLPNLGTSSSEYRASLIREFLKINGENPNAYRLAISPFDTSAYSTTIRDALADDMQAAASAAGWNYLRGCSSPGSANYTDGPLTASSDLTDGTHMNNTGYTKIVNWLAPYIPAATQLGGSILGVMF